MKEDLPGQPETPKGIPEGYAMEFGTGRIIPIRPGLAGPQSTYSQRPRKRRG